MEKVTAGRDALGAFAPKFAELNDDILFGQVWSREAQLSLRDRSLVTVVALMAQGLVDSSSRFHLENAKNNGVTQEEGRSFDPCPPFMPAGPKPGPLSTWPKRSTASKPWGLGGNQPLLCFPFSLPPARRRQ